MADFQQRRGGGAEGNRTPDLCSAIEVDNGMNGRNPPNNSATVAEREGNKARTALSCTGDASEWVYFFEGAGLIKIGYSTDVNARWGKMNTICPVPINLLGQFPGGRMEERELHAKFRHTRQRGEWFADTPELRAEIQARCDFA